MNVQDDELSSVEVISATQKHFTAKGFPGMDDNAKAIALELAQDLDGELGGGVVAALQDGGNTRAFGIGEAAAAAGLIMSAVQIVMQYYSDKKMSALESYIDEHLQKPSQITPAKRTSIIAKVIEKFSGSGQKAS